MTNRSAWNTSISPGGSATIPMRGDCSEWHVE